MSRVLLFFWASLCWATYMAEHQYYESFCTSAEQKMTFNLTIIQHDLLLFAAYQYESNGDASLDVNRKEFGVEAAITYRDAHSFVLLHDIFNNMCAKGGPEFRRVVFELDGYSCAGFLHEMFVASIIGSQHHDTKRFGVLANYATTKAREVLFQSRNNAYQHVIRGDLDWRYLGRGRVKGEGGESEAMIAEAEILGVPATAVLLGLSEASLCAIYMTSASSPAGVALSSSLREALLNATLYWDRLSLYIGYDTCHVHSQCLADADADVDTEATIREKIKIFLAEIIPIHHFRLVHIKAYSFEHCHPHEVSLLLLYDQLTMTAFQNMDNKYYAYEYIILLNDSPHRDPTVTSARTFSSSSLTHLFSELEHITPDTLIPRERYPFCVFIALASSCTHSFETVATCHLISHIRLPTSLLAVYNGQLLPEAIRHDIVSSLLLQVDTNQGSRGNAQRDTSQSSSHPTTAMSTLAIYLQDMLQPFEKVTFFVTIQDDTLDVRGARADTHFVSPLETPHVSYFQALLQIRWQLWNTLLRQRLQDGDVDPPPSSGIMETVSSTTNLCLRFPSEYHEHKLLLNPHLTLYGPLDLHYERLCMTMEVEMGIDCTTLSAEITPPSLPPLLPLPNLPLPHLLSARSPATPVLSPQPFARPRPKAKIAFFTTILGDYETTCPKIIRQKHTLADFICFTNSPSIINSTAFDDDNQWIIDDYPYHLDADIWSQIDHDSPMYTNSMFNELMNEGDAGAKNSKSRGSNGKKPVDYYNLVKFYKMNFFLFPRMKQYDYVVWLDGTIEIHSEMAAYKISKKLQVISELGSHVMLFEHTRNTMEYEAQISAKDKRWKSLGAGHKAQNRILSQLRTYYQLGYNESNWQKISLASQRPLYGLWVTCFIAYDMRDASTRLFLQSWYTHTQMFSSQCQMSFSFLSLMNRIFSERTGVPFSPYSLPDGDIHGTNRVNSLFRKKRYHGATTI